MNHQPTTLVVKSSDGVKFAVATDAPAIPYERAYGASQPASELERNTDFVRVDDARALTEAFTLSISDGCDTNHEALCRAESRWGQARIYEPFVSDGDEPED
jgi:hypothetical protein